jgi:double-stranded uracil-DNA glycosylase
MDRATIDIYERRAETYQANRVPKSSALANRLAARAHAKGPRLDLGCGPGWYGPMLGEPCIALDAARSMLDLVPDHAPSARRLQGDLAALPFRRHCAASAWANRSYIHLPKVVVPLAFHDLHRVLQVGAPFELVVFEGDGNVRHADDDLVLGEPATTVRRLFVQWQEGELLSVLIGAGFVELETERFEGALVVRGRSGHTLADTVTDNMRVLLVGLNPSLHSADTGFGFAGPGNRFWPALSLAHPTADDAARDPVALVRRHGIGMTDLVKRATPRADEIQRAEYVDGIDRLERLCRWLQPEAVCIVGLSGWRAAVDRKAVTGWQARFVGGRPVYVMPNPSGLNAHDTVDTLAGHLGRALAGPPT